MFSFNYNNIITNLSLFCKNLINLNYHIVFLPFNTSSINTNENDIIIHNDIIELLHNINDNITIINKQLYATNILSIFKLADLSIPMRFHACLFSIYTNTPIIPIYTTRKIKNLLNELEWEYKYELDKNEKDIPLDLNLNQLLYTYKQLQKDKNLQTRLNYINNNILNKNFNDNISNLINCIKYNKVITPKAMRDQMYRNVKECTSFRPLNLTYILQLYNAKSVLDFSSGWGDRLLACLATNTRYIGVDPNELLHPKYKEMIEFFYRNG